MFISAAALLSGCDLGNRSHAADIRGRIWSDGVTVAVPNADTVNLYDMRIALRHESSLNGSRIGMRIRTEAPDSSWCEEPFEMVLCDDGRSMAAAHESECTYRRRVRLSLTGDYRITLIPDNPLRGVTAAAVNMVPATEEER